MNPIEILVERKFANLQASAQVELPGGRRIGSADARVLLRLTEYSPLAHLAAGQVGRLAEDYVEGRLEIEGTMRDLMAVAAQMINVDPTRTPGGSSSWWRGLLRRGRALARHSADADARQVQFHYDVSDDFYALWLDARRVYSCAYYREAGMPLAQAQEAKLDHVCRKLMLREGERFLDIGAGWGGLLLWAAENYGVQATGITLSKNQHAHVNRLIEQRGPYRARGDEAAGLPRAARDAPLGQDRLDRHVRACGPRHAADLLRQDSPAAEAGRPADEPRHHRRRHAQRATRRRHRRLHRALHLPGRRIAACVARAARDGRRRPGAAGCREPAPALCAHAVGLVRRSGIAPVARARDHRRSRRSRLPAVPGRLGDELRTRLDLAEPDAGKPTQWQPGRRCACAGPSRCFPSSGATCIVDADRDAR